MAPADSGFYGRRLALKPPTVLHLGVLDQPYATPGKRSQKVMTTFEVAKILERNYGLFSLFWQAHGADAAEDMGEALKASFEAMLMGQAIHPYCSAMSKIEHRFRQFLSNREIERMQFAPRTRIADHALLQIPTKAALKGIRHRHGKVSGGSRRPSFIDSGLLQTSFRAWTG